MAERIEGLSIGLDLDSVKVESGLQDLNKKLSLVNSEMKANMSAFDQGDKSLQKYQVQLDGLNKKLSVQQARVDSARKTYDKMVAAHGEGSKEAEKAAIALNKESASLNNLERYIGKVTEEMNKSNSVLVKYGTQLTNIAEKAGKVGSVLTTTVTPAMLAIGAAAIIGANNAEDAFIKIQNNMGSTVEETEKLKNIANNVFKDGWGDSLDSVVTSLLEVKEQLGNIPDEELESITKQAIALEQSLGMDTTESLRGVNALMTTYGLTAQQAFDYIVKGAQNGLNKTDELGDNLAEYVPLWEQNGYSIEEMFSTLQAGLNAGAYNLDKVNDLVKEFGVRVGDGTIKKAVEEMGGSWNKIYKGWEKAGGTNAELFELLANNLASIEDPQAKQLALTEIWGSMGEDAGLKVVEALGKVENGYEDVSGAAQKVTENLELSRAQQFQALLRGMADTLVPLGDILLDIGEDALPILQDAVESINDAWESLSDEQQEMVVQFGLTAAAAGPVIKVLSGITGGAGKLLTKLPELTKGTNNTSKALETMTTMAASGTKGTSVLTKGVIGLTTGLNPATLAVGGLLLALGAGTVVWQAWGKDVEQARNETSRWGTTVGSEANNALADFSYSTSEMDLAMQGFSNGIEGSAESVTKNFSNMLSIIKKNAEDTSEEFSRIIAGLPESARKLAEENQKLMEEEMESGIKRAEGNAAAVQTIMENASKQKRDLTAEERLFIQSSQEDMFSLLLDSLGIYGDKRMAIEERLSKDVSELTANEALQQAQIVHESLETITKSHEEQVAAIKEAWNQGLLSPEQYEAEMQKLNASSEAMTDSVILNFIDLMKQADQTDEQIRLALGDMGYNYDDYKNKVAENTDDLEGYNGKLIQSTKEMSKEQQEANNLWNQLMWNDKEAKVYDNMGDAINNFFEAGGTWEELNFTLKNANLDSNAKQEMIKVLLENGRWEGLDWNTKKALLETNSAQTAYQYLVNHGQWQNLTFDQKWSILSSNSPATTEQALKDVGLWNSLSPKVKNAILNTNAPSTVARGVQARNTWNGLKYGNKHANLNTNAESTRSKLKYANDYFSNIRSGSKTFELITKYKTTGKATGAGIGYAKGTNFHPGGPAILGDGGKNEPFMTPEGDFGISPNIDTLFHLPRGTKVWPSIEAWESKIPHFANGSANTPTDAMKLLALAGNRVSERTVRDRVSVQHSETVLESSSQAVFSELIEGQKAIVQALGQIMSSQGKPFVFQIGYSEIARALVPIVDKELGKNIEDSEGKLIL